MKDSISQQCSLNNSWVIKHFETLLCVLVTEIKAVNVTKTESHIAGCILPTWSQSLHRKTNFTSFFELILRYPESTESISTALQGEI